MKTIKVTTNNEISLVDVNFDDFKDIQRVIGGHFESVCTERIRSYFGPGIILIVDEEGRLKGLPKNPLGCYFYGTSFHGEPIVGDFILAKVVGEDWTAPDEVEELMKNMLRTFNLKEVKEDGNED